VGGLFSDPRRNVKGRFARSTDNRRGECFEVVRIQVPTSPLDVPGVKTKANMADVLKAVRESRVR